MAHLACAVSLLAMAALLALSSAAAQAVREGLSMCAATVVPALFPFLVLSSFFTAASRGLPDSRLLHRLGRFLGCGSRGAEVFLLSLLGGYPVGARLVGQLRRSGQLSPQESEHLLLFCNNAGPAFILGLVGLGRFGSLRHGLFLWLIHTAAAILTARLFRPAKPFSATSTVCASTPAFAEALVDAIAGAGSTTVQLCSFVTFFYTALHLFSQKSGISQPLVLGLVELTQGVLQLRNTRGGFVAAAALLGWGGLSVHCQTAAVLSGTGLSLRNHLQGKLCHAAFSALLALPLSFLA